MLSDDKTEKIWTIVKLALNAVFLSMALLALAGGADIMNVIIIAALGGIPTAWKLMARSPEDKFRDALDDHAARVTGGIGDSLMQSAIRFIMRIILTFIVGAIAAPILLIVNTVKLVKCIKRIELNEQLLADFA